MDAMLGAIAFDTTTERTQRFTLDAIMNANNLIFFLECVTGFYSQRPSVSNVCNREVSDCLDRLLAGTHNTSVRRRRAAERLEKACCETLPCPMDVGCHFYRAPECPTVDIVHSF
jgi:hypothetical protein